MIRVLSQGTEVKKLSEKTRAQSLVRKLTDQEKSIGVFRDKVIPSPLDGRRFESALGDLLGFLALHEHWRTEFHGFGLQPRRLL
jgi:hypothetical protein